MNCHIEVLTPVHVGNGQVLSQFTDYVYDDGVIYYLNHDLLAQELMARPNGDRLMDEYVRVVQSQARGNQRGRIRLNDFLVQTGLDYKRLSYRSIAVTDKIKEQIQLQVKSGSSPIIPGSSIKGAIRTAIILAMKRHFDSLPQQRPYIGQDLFGAYGNDVLKYLHVSDSQPFSEQELGVARFYKLNLRTGNVDLPMNKEVITRGSVSRFSIKTMATSGVKQHPYLQIGQEGRILQFLNQSAEESIRYELQQLKRNPRQETEELIDFYSALLERVQKADSQQEAYLRLGAGKTFVDMTIARRLSEQHLRQVIVSNFKGAHPQNFPRTRTIIMDGMRKWAPGWIRIEKVD